MYQSFTLDNRNLDMDISTTPESRIIRIIRKSKLDRQHGKEKFRGGTNTN